MKISELIKELKLLSDLNPDLPVRLHEYCNITDVDIDLDHFDKRNSFLDPYVYVSTDCSCGYDPYG